MSLQSPSPAPENLSCEIADGFLVIRIPLKTPAAVSASGKSLMVASTGGNVITKATHEGKPIVLGLNAFVPINGIEGSPPVPDGTK